MGPARSRLRFRSRQRDLNDRRITMGGEHVSIECIAGEMAKGVSLWNVYDVCCICTD